MSLDLEPWSCLVDNYWIADSKDQWFANSNRTKFLTILANHPEYGEIACEIERINEWEFSWKVEILHKPNGYWEIKNEISGFSGSFSEAKSHCDFYFCETTSERLVV